MTDEELRAKLADTETQLAIAKSTIERMREADGFVIMILHKYRCKICNFVHLPQPVNKCERQNDNRSACDEEEPDHKRLLNEFEAALKQCIDERGDSGWQFIDVFAGNDVLERLP